LNRTIIEIYTDGSCHTKFCTGAWAAILLVNHEKLLLKGEAQNTTHNRMELLAVINAIEFIDKKWTDVTLIIYTDSQYVDQIRNRKEKLTAKHFITKKGTPIQNCDLVKILIEQMETHSIEFVKVKAHQKPEKNLVNTSADYNREVDMIVRELMRNTVKFKA
jgi:ribonuclease HI